jgi:hypothetical protein
MRAKVEEGATNAYVTTVLDGHKGYFLGDVIPPVDCNNMTSNELQSCRQQNLDLRIFDAQLCRVDTDFIKVRCQTGQGYGVNHLWQIEVSGQKSNIGSAPKPERVFGSGAWVSQTTSYAPPTIISFDGTAKQDANTNGGQEVILKGTQYGLSSDSAVTKVTYGLTGTEYVIANFSVSQDHTQLTCKMEEGIGGTLKWIVTVSGQTSETPTTSYGKPHILDLSGIGASFASTVGNDTIHLHGRNFGPSISSEALELVVKYGEGGDLSYVATDCVVSIPHERITCRTAVGKGTDLQWQVSVGGQQSALSENRTAYQSPHISRTYNVRNGLLISNDRSNATGTTIGGVSMQLVGSNFGGQGDAKVYWGGDKDANEIKGVAYIGESHDKLEFSTPEGAGTGKQIHVVVKGQVSNSVSFDYLPPKIDSLSLISGVKGREVTLRLRGQNFGPSESRNMNISLYQNVEKTVLVGNCSIDASTKVKDLNAAIYALSRDSTHEDVYCSTSYDDIFMVMYVNSQSSTPKRYAFSDLLAVLKPSWPPRVTPWNAGPNKHRFPNCVFCIKLGEGHDWSFLSHLITHHIREYNYKT